jgi:RNA polymerase sigma-70 factor (ECF subfamily)
MNANELAPLLLDRQTLLSSVAFNLTRNYSTAEELVLTTIEKAVKYAESFDGENLNAWLVTILRNTFRNDYRSDVRANMSLVTVDEVVDLGLESTLGLSKSAEYEALADTFSPEVLSAWNSLTLGQKEVIYLVDIQGLSYREASETLQIEEGTVMSRLSRGRKVLKEALV